MRSFEKQGGISFLLIYYSHKDLMYYLTLQHLNQFWERAKSGGRKSFRFEELDETFIIHKKQGVLIPYLDVLQKDLDERQDD